MTTKTSKPIHTRPVPSPVFSTIKWPYAENFPQRTKDCTAEIPSKVHRTAPTHFLAGPRLQATAKWGNFHIAAVPSQRLPAEAAPRESAVPQRNHRQGHRFSDAAHISNLAPVTYIFFLSCSLLIFCSVHFSRSLAFFYNI